MSLLPQKNEISDAYPNPSSDVARIGFDRLWTSIYEFFEKPEEDVASSTTCDIGNQLSTKLRITGTTGITSFGTSYRGPIHLRFAAALTITHNATTLICPGGVNITTEAGDILIVSPKAASGTANGWEVSYLPYAGSATPLVDAASAVVGTSKRYARADHVHPTAAIGVGQTWQNVMASRVMGTTYTNSTGRPIQVSMAAAISAASAWLTMTVNGVTVAISSGTYATGARAEITGVVVPSGCTYSVSTSAGTATLQTWAELR